MNYLRFPFYCFQVHKTNSAKRGYHDTKKYSKKYKISKVQILNTKIRQGVKTYQKYVFQCIKIRQ